MSASRDRSVTTTTTQAAAGGTIPVTVDNAAALVASALVLIMGGWFTRLGLRMQRGSWPVSGWRTGWLDPWGLTMAAAEQIVPKVLTNPWMRNLIALGALATAVVSPAIAKVRYLRAARARRARRVRPLPAIVPRPTALWWAVPLDTAAACGLASALGWRYGWTFATTVSAFDLIWGTWRIGSHWFWNKLGYDLPPSIHWLALISLPAVVIWAAKSDAKILGELPKPNGARFGGLRLAYAVALFLAGLLLVLQAAPINEPAAMRWIRMEIEQSNRAEAHPHPDEGKAPYCNASLHDVLMAATTLDGVALDSERLDALAKMNPLRGLAGQAHLTCLEEPEVRSGYIVVEVTDPAHIDTPGALLYPTHDNNGAEPQAYLLLPNIYTRFQNIVPHDENIDELVLARGHLGHTSLLVVHTSGGVRQCSLIIGSATDVTEANREDGPDCNSRVRLTLGLGGIPWVARPDRSLIVHVGPGVLDDSPPVLPVPDPKPLTGAEIERYKCLNAAYTSSDSWFRTPEQGVIIIGSCGS
jgi:hypothetical protein